MKKILILLFSALLLITLATASFADVDFSFDDGGFSGGGFGGDFDDFDFDSGSGGGWLFFTDGSPLSIIAIVVIVIAFVIIRSKAGRNRTARTFGQSPVSLSQDGGKSEAEVAALIKMQDPAFSADEMRAYAKDCFIRLQEAWEAKDSVQVQGFASDSYYHANERNMQQLLANGWTNHMDSQCILSADLCDYKQDGKTETVIVRLHATLIDYVTDDKTGSVIQGSRTERQDRWYRLAFIRSSGVRTEASAGLSTHQCPSCGAAIELNATGHCAYCGNAITSGQYGWVLNEYGRWSM